MPYSGADDPKLPSNVKKMDEKKRRQWVHVFNSAMSSGDDESSAFAQANGVAKKDYIEGYDVTIRQLDKGKAGYNAVGGNNEKACANCNWYVSPDGCILVGGVISPTGLSDYWLMKQEYVEHPIPVMVVESEDSSELSVDLTIGDGAEEPHVSLAPAVQDEKAVWSTAFVNNLPDSSFAYIEPGGTKDSEGKTTPRSKRHLPYKNASGEPDAAHVRNALARLNQTDISSSAKSSAHGKLAAAAKKLNIEVSEKEFGGAIVNHIIDFAKGLLGKKQEPVFTLFKNADGDLRFFAIPSNMYEDRQGQILTSEAHKDFVNWVDSTGFYPHLWIWHIPGSRIGRCDWLDFTEDGMLCASGIIDKEFENVALELAQKDVAMSHGFFRFGDLPYINKYRSFEISVLPRERVANFGTDFMLGDKEMAFSEEKRKLLVDSGVSENQIKQWEEGADKFGQQMKQMGIAWKEDEVKEEAQQVSEIAQLTSVVSTLVDKIGEIETTLGSRVEAVEKSFDEKVEEAFTAQIAKMPQGYKPSEAGDNVQTTQTKESITDDTMEFFYGQVVGKVGQ